MEETEKMTPKKAVAVLRNREGLDEDKIGYGNEKALNQMLAHHGIVFQPEDLLVWVSSNPYQMGEFVAYDLKDVFSNKKKGNASVAKSELNIAKDPFLETDSYAKYESYRILSRTVSSYIASGKHLDKRVLNTFKLSNPEFWEVYYLVGKYYLGKGYDTLATREPIQALCHQDRLGFSSHKK